ncbi:unnamed protein product [Merluccius merluccius]
MANFGEILQATGDFGLFQKLLILALGFPNILLAVSFASVLFVDSDPKRHCNTDWILAAGPNLTEEEQLNLTVPRETDGSLSRCLMYSPVDWTLDSIRQYGLNHTTACQDGWVYDQTLYQATIVTDFNLVCDKAHLAGIAQTVFMSGILAGSFIFGPASEPLGRKMLIQAPTCLLMVFTLVSGLSVNLYMYLAAQFMVGVSIGGYRINASVLGTEWLGITKRSFAPCVNQLLASIGQCATAGLMYGARDWRLALYVLSGPVAVVSIYIWFIPESARWLLTKGRHREAKEWILKAAKINKRVVPDNLLESVTIDQAVKREGIKTLFKSPTLRKYILIMSFAWFSTNLGYFSLSLNVGNFGLNIFLVQLMFGLSQMPAQLLCFCMLEVLGRKKSILCTTITGSFVCFVTLAFSQERSVVIAVLATVGRFLFTCSSSVFMVYGQELFPTSVRQQAVGLCSILVRVAGLLSPLLNLLAVHHWTIPIIVFSSLTLMGGALTFLLPETRGTELADSTEQAEEQRR